MANKPFIIKRHESDGFTLSDRVAIKVRFNESDPLGIVWHGHYLRYFEDGRESFGEKYGLRYLDFYKMGYIVPIVSLNCNYKKTLKYGDTAIVETTFRDSPAAKIHFHFRLYKPDSAELIAEGSSVQVFLNAKNMQLQLTIPDFFEKWKIKHRP